jgi:hypothetical protein
MNKVAPLVGFAVAAFFCFRAASQFPDPLADSPKSLLATPPVVGNPPETQSDSSPATPRQATAQRPYEPAHKVLIRCLSDVDDLLDTIRDPASFAAVKPKLLSRVRQHVAQASEHPNPGMARLSRAAAQEMQKAMNRHTESLIRADRVAPGVRAFFEKDIAAILNAK